ncbi:AMP-binding protein [Pseudorhodoferax sp.]|uniref:AMP-binding protein n=1 Tax=Pseudorhodoferax sp. TaxID=1993553 RepID=UPI002DD6539C|nr:AMP-binding protein [Pseudorhodoferax sp.]
MPAPTRHLAHWPAGVPHQLDVPDRHLFSHLAAHAQAAPERTAITYYGRSIAYGALHAATLALAGYLQQRLGVQRGDRVLLLMQNCPQFVVAYYAVLRAGAVVVAVNPMSTPDEVAWYAADSGGQVLVTTQDMLDKVQPLLDDGRLAHGIVGACSEWAGSAQDVPFLQIPDFVRAPPRALAHARLHAFADALRAGLAPGALQGGGPDLAVVAYTSGTTGKPKGAMLSHRNFAHASAQRARWLDERPEETELVVLPISHLAGMNMVNLALFVGRGIVLLSRWDAAAAVALIERGRIAAWGAVAPMLSEVFTRPEFAQRDLSSLRRLYGGATAMPESLIRGIEERLGIAFIESYGLTEGCGATHINPPQAARRQCAGVPHIHCDARVVDPASGAELPQGQDGEIVVRSPTVFQGYWRNAEATAQAFVEVEGQRFLRTGDLGHVDADGYFYVTDRLKRMINASGLKVWPAEIESVLHGHPAVQEVCVVSAFDPRRGETVKALVVPRPAAGGPPGADALIAWARERMAAYKVPRLVEFVEALPKTSTGKLLWRELQARQDALDRPARAMAVATET